MTTSTYTFAPDDPAHRLAEVRRILAEQGARFPQVDHNGRVIPADDTKPNTVDLGGAA